MDIICTNCAEQWDFDSVFHDQPEDFKRNSSGVIIACPCCEGKPQRLDEKTKDLVAKQQILHDILGDDIDGIASMMDDLL